MNNSVFTGRRRRGKTTRALSKAMECASMVVVFDPKRELQDWRGEAHSISEVREAMERGEFVIVYHPENVEEEFTALAKFVWAIHEFGMDHRWHQDKNHKPIVFLVDEAHQMQTPWNINAELKAILQKCRPEILVLAQTTQSPSYLYSASKIANSEWYFFYTTHPADLERIEKIAGKEVRNLVSSLEDNRQYVFFSEDTQEFFLVTDSDSWKCDLIYQSKEQLMAKQKIEVDEDFMSELVNRVAKALKPGKTTEDDDDDDMDNKSKSGGFVLSFGKKKE